MSLFDANGKDPSQSAPVVPETPEAILAQVTDKFKNDKGELDVVALAKGKLEADNFIKRLTDEQAGLRQDLNSRAQLEELIEDLKKARLDASKTESQVPPNGQVPPDANATALTLEAVKALLKDELSQTQKHTLAQRNVDFAEQELAKQWGTDTRRKLETKARDLDVSLDFLKSLAAQKPKAFLEMVGAKPVNTPVNVSDVTPPTTRDNAGYRQAPAGRNEAYYQKLRRDKPTEYWSAQVQKQEMADALAMGDAFFQ